MAEDSDNEFDSTSKDQPSYEQASRDAWRMFAIAQKEQQEGDANKAYIYSQFCMLLAEKERTEKQAEMESGKEKDGKS